MKGLAIGIPIVLTACASVAWIWAQKPAMLPRPRPAIDVNAPEIVETATLALG